MRIYDLMITFLILLIGLFAVGCDEDGGVSRSGAETIKVNYSSLQQYELSFVDANANEVTVPFSYYNTFSSTLKMGNADDNLIFNEYNAIRKNDYFILTAEGNYSEGGGNSYVLRYKGVDKLTDANPVIKFDVLGNSRMEKSYTINQSIGTPDIILYLGGKSFGVQDCPIYLCSDVDTSQDDFPIQVDLNGDGYFLILSDVSSPLALEMHNIKINTKAGFVINISNRTEFDDQLGRRKMTTAFSIYDSSDPIHISYKIDALYRPDLTLIKTDTHDMTEVGDGVFVGDAGFARFTYTDIPGLPESLKVTNE